MFREEHYHITLSNETPPRTFFRISCDLFTGQLFHKMHERSYICLVSQIVIWGRITQWHGDILNRSNSSMFLLRKPFEIGKCLISSAPQEFEWSPKGKCQNLLAQILWRRRLTSTLVKSDIVFQKDSPEAVLEKSWFEKLQKKFTQKKLL